ncbi:protein kinase subdomain-containing protein PKL/CAK/Fmp29 [Schizopora paradoxa]|uniref:Protein kinase subdomain-containing protein PKL/CAK/Fmp29 n=1 Tax=Schizopora paradoxa TaxID=27342 RepID=A0A0H2SHX6_9AGAM|nr:protein kinase subdomain-containing protein PKL/CAK/Fmp29 [Schizopora paradoxa]
MKPFPQSIRLSFSAAAHQATAIDNLSLNPHDLFEFTSGRWIYNDELRRAERRNSFNVEGLLQLAAESVKRSLDEIVRFEKLAEGGFNRVFLITMRDGFRPVARIPYSITTPKFFAVASEVATLAFLRGYGLPVAEPYGYSPTTENSAGTEYIFLQYLEGISFSSVFYTMDEGEIISVLRQIAELERKFMSINFPAGESLYFTEDLKYIKAAGVPTHDEDFSVGPETSSPLWSGRRGLLDVDRGPYATFEEALARGAEKEKAYLQKFGRPLHPFQRIRRPAYEYQEQSPSDHIENLERYLNIVPSLVHKPEDSNRARVLNRFCIRHPDIQPNNIIVSRSPDTNSYRVVGLIDWQHAAILPLSLQAGFTPNMDNYGDTGWDPTQPPSLPENFDALDKAAQESEMIDYRHRLLHYYYIKSMEELNYHHYCAMMEPMGMLRRRLFYHARSAWDGETLDLKVALIEAAQKWEALSETKGEPCPLAFDPEDVRKTEELEAEVADLDGLFKRFQGAIGFGAEGRVPTERYEESLAFCKKLKEDGLLKIEDEEVRAQIIAHWPFDNMDERDYI